MMLQFDNVSVRHADGTRALYDVSFVVPAGQFCVVLGHSGAGKSTLLRAVNGLTPIARGAIRVGGQHVDGTTLPALRRRIGMIHQHFGLTARASVATNMMAGAAPAMPLWRALLGVYPAAQTARACALIAAVGLEEAHLARRVDRLSGGQQQRVGIARAFMLEPALILADEPVASLDPRLGREILELIREQARMRGATVLCSLHQFDLAQLYADRIVALRAGRIVFDGPAAMIDRHDLRRIYAQRHGGPVAAVPEMAW